MQCEEALRRLDAYVDGELAKSERLALSDHLSGCLECREAATGLTGLSAQIRAIAPRYPAPSLLREHIREELRQADDGTAAPLSTRRLGGQFAYAASLLLAVALGAGGTALLLGQQRTDEIAEQLLDDHLRSLLASHLTDVASADQHTVKPWFAGRTEVSPAVVDLAADGFPLVGGRLDLVSGKPVPALVYRRRQHVINLFVLPEKRGGHKVEPTRHGYNLIYWEEGDLGFWAVSDAAPSELTAFVKLYRAATGK